MSRASTSYNYFVSKKTIPFGTYDIYVSLNGKASKFNDSVFDTDYPRASGTRISVTSSGGSATINYYTVKFVMSGCTYYNIISNNNDKLTGGSSLTNDTKIVLSGTKINRIHADIPQGYNAKLTYSKSKNELATPNYSSTSANWQYSFPAINTPITIVCHTSPIVYTARFNTGGGVWADGTVSEKNVTYTIESKGLLAPSTATREGYIFSGYKIYNNSSGKTNMAYFKQPYVLDESGNMGNLTITLTWRKATYRIEYNLDGITEDGKSLYKKSYEENIKMPNAYDSVCTIGSVNYYRNPTVIEATSNPKQGYSKFFTVDNPIRNGYHFVGWLITDIELSPSYSASAYAYDIRLNERPQYEINGVDSDITSMSFSTWKNSSPHLFANLSSSNRVVKFTAVWKPITYTATFIPNGGKWSDSTTTNKTKGYTIENLLTAPSTISRSGYIFTGWKVTTVAGNWTATNYCSTAQIRLADVAGKYGNVTFTAQWRATYTIKYNLNGGTLANGTNKTYTGDSLKYYRNPTSQKFMGAADAGYSKYFMVDTPTKTGYVFNGWTVTGMNSNTHYIWANNKANTSTATSFANTSTFGKAKLFYNLRSTPGTVTFTANWKPVTYTATFVPNSGKWSDSTTASKAKSYTIENVLSVPATISRSGYIFIGWKVTTAGGNWTANSIFNNSPQTKLVGATGKYGNVTFTAQWRATYTIKYNLNGGTFANELNTTYTSGNYKYYRNPTSQKVMGNADAGYNKYFKVETPTRAGYKFNGWTITGMNSNTHYIWVNNQSNTSTATTFANTSAFGKATLFYNLRNTPSTVTFTANWIPVK